MAACLIHLHLIELTSDKGERWQLSKSLGSLGKTNRDDQGTIDESYDLATRRVKEV